MWGVQSYRKAIVAYIRSNANPPDKFSHQERLYRIAIQIAAEHPFDDEVVFAAAWLHDLGVFVGHRPENPTALGHWDHIAYAVHKIPALLRDWGYPEHKIGAVLEVIKTHMPQHMPVSFEGMVIRDADILEQLGAVGILRTVSKIGRDTRFICFKDAVRALQTNLETLPMQLKLPTAIALARDRVKILRSFVEAAETELGRQI